MDIAEGDPGSSARVPLVGATVGQPYVVQVGAWLWQDTTPNGILEFGDLPLPANHSCASPEPLVGEVTVTWDDFHPGVGTSGFDGGAPTSCPSAANPAFTPLGPIVQDLFFVWTPTCDGSYRFRTNGGATIVDTTIAVHQGSDCLATCLAWDTDSGSEFGDAALQVEDLVAGEPLLIQVGASNPGVQGGRGSLTVTRVDQPCGDTNLTLACDPANPHHLGGSVTLAGSALGTGSGSGLHVEALDGPPGEFGVLLVAEDTSLQWTVLGGVICLGPPQGRYDGWNRSGAPAVDMNSIGVFDADGRLQRLAGSSTSGAGYDVPVELPIGIPQTEIQSGDTWGFQVWYRDHGPLGQPTSNFSNLLVVTFP
jgi:hypothetical protein